MTTLVWAQVNSPERTRRTHVVEHLKERLSLDESINLQLAESRTLDESARVLYHLLTGGYAVWEDGTLYYVRATVDMIGHLRIEIRLTEHAPPHFHVAAGSLNASFAIEDCAHLAGSISGRDRLLVRRWFAGARPLLVRKWNETRPSDCPVGPIRDA